MRHIYIPLALALFASPALAERTPECAPQNKGCSAHSVASNVAGGSTGSPNNPGPGGGKGNNGHGNGDQSAPGNSGPHNNAENSEHSGQGNSGNGKGGKK